MRTKAFLAVVILALPCLATAQEGKPEKMVAVMIIEPNHKIGLGIKEHDSQRGYQFYELIYECRSHCTLKKKSWEKENSFKEVELAPGKEILFRDGKVVVRITNIEEKIITIEVYTELILKLAWYEPL